VAKKHNFIMVLGKFRSWRCTSANYMIERCPWAKFAVILLGFLTKFPGPPPVSSKQPVTNLFSVNLDISLIAN
jgi:hypothetical protein